MTFLSCKMDTGANVILTGKFPFVDSLEMIPIKNVDLLCPDDLVFQNGYLVLNNNCHDHLIQIIRLKDLQSKHFIKKGRGPGEMSRANFSGHMVGDSLFIRNAPESSIWINPKKLFNNKHKENGETFKKISDPTPISQNENVFFIEDNWVFNDYSSSNGHLGFFVFLDKKGEIIKKTDYIPELSYQINKNTKGYAYLTTTRINESQKKFVSALKYFPFFIITTNDGEYELVVQTEKDYLEPEFKEGEIHPDFRSEFFYAGVVLSEKYIFLYRLNMTLGELVNYFSGQGGLPETSPGFEVYTWEGKPVCYLKINKVIIGPSIDFEKGVVYGLVLDPDIGYNIVKGDISPNILGSLK